MKTEKFAHRAIARLEKASSFILEDQSKAPPAVKKAISLVKKLTGFDCIVYHPVYKKEWTLEAKGKVKDEVGAKIVEALQQDNTVAESGFSQTYFGNSLLVSLR